MKIRIFVFLLLTGLATSVQAAQLEPAEIFQNAAPSVVVVWATDPGKKSGGVGTGSIIRKDGLVLTNAHVIFHDESDRPYRKIDIILFPDNPAPISGLKRESAILLKYSRELDLALLKIQPGNRNANFPIIQFSDSNEVKIGDPVAAIGHPESAGLWTQTTGTISSQINDFEGNKGKHVFQTEASINKGNSGGPLIDAGGGNDRSQLEHDEKGNRRLCHHRHKFFHQVPGGGQVA